jgi:hypothetical protein
LKTQSLLVVLVQFFGLLFAFFAFGLTIRFSDVHAPGGSLLNVLSAQPIYRLPVSIIGGLFILFVFASLVAYPLIKRRDALH